MDDAEVIATISAGNLDGLAAALNRYAEQLYDYCHAMAPEDAAEAVEDTFIVAWSKLHELRDPGKLYPWLQAVASNECFRRRLARGLTGPPDSVPTGSPLLTGGTWMPTEIPGRVLSACADNTPPGRARRVSATHRAGPFGFDGFPKTGPRPGTPRNPLRRHPLAVAGVAAAVVAAAATGAVVFQLAGAPRHIQAAGGRAKAPVSPAKTASGAGLPTTPATPIASSTPITPTVSASPSSLPPNPAAGLAPTPPPPATERPAAVPEASPPAIPMASVAPAAAQGVLYIDPARIVIVSHNGGTSTGKFVVTAEGGPVTGYTITVPYGLPGSLTVSPASGSLVAGASATITVTVASSVPFAAALTVERGGQLITVEVKANPGNGGGDGG